MAHRPSRMNMSRLLALGTTCTRQCPRRTERAAVSDASKFGLCLKVSQAAYSPQPPWPAFAASSADAARRLAQEAERVSRGGGWRSGGSGGRGSGSHRRHLGAVVDAVHGALSAPRNDRVTRRVIAETRSLDLRDTGTPLGPYRLDRLPVYRRYTGL